MRILFPISFLALLAVACSSNKTDSSPSSSSGSSGASSGGSSGSSSGSSGGSSGASGSSSGSTSSSGSSGNEAALSCLSYTFCSSRTVATYYGETLPALQGGTIADGLYREGYVLSSAANDGFGNTVSPNTDSGDAILVQGATYLRMGGLGELGALATSSSTLTLTPTYACASETGMQESAGGDVLSYTYGVDGNGNLQLMYSGASTTVKVFLKVTQLCGGVDSAPATPGDSFACHVENCGCAENTGAAADADTCKFVDGD